MRMTQRRHLGAAFALVSSHSHHFLASAFISPTRKVSSWGTQHKKRNIAAAAAAFYRSYSTLFTEHAAAPARISYEIKETLESNTTVVIARKDVLKELVSQHSQLSELLDIPNLDASVINTMMSSLSGASGSSTTFIPLPSGDVHRLSFCSLPVKVSRNNHPLSVHKMTDLISKVCPAKGTTRLFIAGLDDDNDDSEVTPGALSLAIAKSFPLYSRKSSSKDENLDENPTSSRHITVQFLSSCGKLTTNNPTLPSSSQIISDAVRLAAHLVDMPPNELTPTAYADRCRDIAAEFSDGVVSMTEIVGEELKERGYGGIYGVGQAAICPPRLIVMEYDPDGISPSKSNDDNSNSTFLTVLVGKGITYDTGGLSLKTKTGMCGMKHDMAGSAALLGAFYAAAKLKHPQKLVLILCIAENAIGSNAFRNDDILTMYSGKTVEVNNCDAEGRLLLADGVAHAARHYPDVDLILDMATLTGAQLVATGKTHAGILANQKSWEEKCVVAGKRSGDLCFPLLYAPELLKGEFDSKVADMKNSVKDRGNAQSSCAGHFIESHLPESYEGGWVHVDMAGPGSKAGRGTGYGVGLTLSLLGVKGF